jgi:hypothetical protein
VENTDLTWDDVALLDESRLRELIQDAHVVQPKLPRPQPGRQTIHTELQKKGVTLLFLPVFQRREFHGKFLGILFEVSEGTPFQTLTDHAKSTLFSPRVF